MNRILSNIGNWISTKPYKIFWGVLPIVVIIGFVISRNSIDLQMHDTYFVIGVCTIALYSGVWFSIVGLLYFLFSDRKLIHWMSALHVVCSILAFLIIVVVADSRGMAHIDVYNFEESRKIMKVAIGSMIAFVIAQTLFFLNLIQSFFRK